MYLILDTDVLTILQEEKQPACGRLLERLRTQPADSICTTVVSFQERVQGWMAVLNQARSATRIVLAYAKLEMVLRSFCKTKLLAFDDAAQRCFDDLRKQRVRIDTMDLRIASIALATGSKLLSCNLRHFRQVPGLRAEDWTL